MLPPQGSSVGSRIHSSLHIVKAKPVKEHGYLRSGLPSLGAKFHLALNKKTKFGESFAPLPSRVQGFKEVIWVFDSVFEL